MFVSQGMSCTPEQLARQLTAQLEAYGKLASEQVDSIIEDVGNESLKQVKAASPHRKGTYRRSWKVKIERRGYRMEVTIYSAKHYQRTHLLENGHRTRLGTGRHGRVYGTKATVAAQPHIEEVNAWAQRELEQRIRQALGGG